MRHLNATLNATILSMEGIFNEPEFVPNLIFTKVDILYSNCSHITFELNWVFILNFGSFFLLLRLQNIFSF